MYTSLAELGQRICIIGPSNSGKSTLAKAIALKKSLPLVHLDQLYHLPDSKWIPRTQDEFFLLHQQTISEDYWVIEGNYSKCLNERLERATGLILLDVSRARAILRYIIRCYSSTPRIGGLNRDKDSMTWEMVKHILYYSPKSHHSHRILYKKINLPKVIMISPKMINDYFTYWEL